MHVTINYSAGEKGRNKIRNKDSMRRARKEKGKRRQGEHADEWKGRTATRRRSRRYKRSR